LVEDEASVATALDLWAQGLDFADAIHLTSRQVGSTFVSFDKALVKRATRAGLAATLPY
jgi:predicted nucleic acid-binding protein